MKKIGKVEKYILNGIIDGTISKLSNIRYKGVKNPLFLSENHAKYIRSKIKDFEKEGIINLGGERVVLTQKGLNLQRVIKIEDEGIFNIENKWNGNWQIISYDIPEKFKIARNYFTSKLKEFGFYNLQKSLWVYPYECKEEISVLANEIGVSNFVMYMQSDRLPQEEKIKNYFHLE